MRFITLGGLLGGFIGSLLFTMFFGPAGIPAHIWVTSIFGGGVFLMMLVEVFMVIFGKGRK